MVYRRIVFAAAQAVGFADAAEALGELGELPMLSKRVWRAAKRIGEERIEELHAARKFWSRRLRHLIDASSYHQAS